MSSARQNSRFYRSASFRSGLWPQHASAPSSDSLLSAALPLSGTPPSPSARQARLISPSHSLPEFLPVLDEASTLKAPLVLPPSAYLGVAASAARPVPQLPPLPSGRRSTYDLRRCASFHSGTSSQDSFPGYSGSGSSHGATRPGQGAGPGGALVEWVPHLMVFSLLCLVMTVATVAFTVSVVDEYDQTATGHFFQISDIHWDPLYRSVSYGVPSCWLLASPCNLPTKRDAELRVRDARGEWIKSPSCSHGGPRLAGNVGRLTCVSPCLWPMSRYHGSPKSFCRRSLLAESDKPFGQYGCDR